MVLVISLFVLGAPLVSRSLGEAQSTPLIIINELNWMGSSSSTADEWLELRNLGSESIDLSGWRITKLSNGVESTMLDIPFGKNIEPNGYFLITNYAATNVSSSLNVAPHIIDTDVALNNSNLQIKLYDQNGVLHDSADDGSGNPLSGRYISAEKIYASMERNPDPGDGTRIENWHTATRAVGFKDGKSELGTPGSVNSNGQPVAVAGDDQTGTVGLEVSFDGSESVDPDGQALTFSWNFGDETTSSEPAPRHTYTALGKYVVTLTVSDGTDSGQDTLEIVVDPAPAATTITHPQPPITPIQNLPIVATTSCRGVTISELFPNPDGVDDGEFIELYNSTNTPIVVDGCSLWVNEKRKVTLKNIEIQGKKYAVIFKATSKLSLTNTGGRLILRDTDGSDLGYVLYPKAPEHESWALVGREWVWTNQVTPGKKNIGPVDDEEIEKRNENKFTEAPQTVGLEDVQAVETGTLVMIRGVVTVEPDCLGSQIIFLQSRTGAISAVLPKDAAKVTVGDEVEVIGKVRLFQGRKRIGVESAGVRVLAQRQLVEPQKISLDQLSSEFADQLINVSGVISANSGAKFLIDDGTSEADVYLKSSTGIVKPRSVSGDRLIATGIVSVSTSGIRILPRTVEDLRVERILGATTVAAPTPQVLPTASANQSMWYWVLVGIGLVGAGIKPAIEFFRKRKNPANSVEGLKPR